VTGPLTCAEMRDVLPDLALGTLSGDDRASVLDHLGSCPSCAVEAGELSAVVDDILLLAPEIDPPAGFESAVLARMERMDRAERPVPARPAWRRPRLLLGALAASLVLVAGTAVAVAASRGPEHGLDEQYVQAIQTLGGRELRAAPLKASSQVAWGDAFVYEGHTSWVFVSMRWDAPDGDYRVVLDRSDGPSATVGRLHLVRGEGTAGMTVGDTHTVTVVRIVDATGRTMCSAQLPDVT